MAGKVLPLLLPNLVELAAPAGEPGAAKWKKQLELDGATIRARANRKTLADALGRCALAPRGPGHQAQFFPGVSAAWPRMGV